MKRIISLTGILLLNVSMAAQSLVGSEYSYRHYGIADGLPTEIVECVYQDSRGFIWFGTEHGCVCFDGHTFNPAFWQTWWFYLACTVLLLLVTGFFAYLYFDWRSRRKIAALERQRRLNNLQIQSVRLRSIPHFNANVLAGIEYYLIYFLSLK
jgi:ligand-binding sensor domain-containing protein